MVLSTLHTTPVCQALRFQATIAKLTFQVAIEIIQRVCFLASLPIPVEKPSALKKLLPMLQEPSHVEVLLAGLEQWILSRSSQMTFPLKDLQVFAEEFPSLSPLPCKKMTELLFT